MRKKTFKTVMLIMAILLSGIILASCGGDEKEQRYAYPLATASPEDTVTQIYAEQLQEHVNEEYRRLNLMATVTE